MNKLVINDFEEFEQYVGERIGSIGLYANHPKNKSTNLQMPTLDHQWIHVDVEKAKAESPCRSTISHGYLNLSILPYLGIKLSEVEQCKDACKLRY